MGENGDVALFEIRDSFVNFSKRIHDASDDKDAIRHVNLIPKRKYSDEIVNRPSIDEQEYDIIRKITNIVNQYWGLTDGQTRETTSQVIKPVQTISYGLTTPVLILTEDLNQYTKTTHATLTSDCLQREV